ncbi:hypothetical protein SLE2022_312050 [Rubroshorea leprosula]
MERFTTLRGKRMHSLYSWSYKRSYKNGYVWKDLEENDVIYSLDGAKCVLKGSKLVDGSSISKRFQLGSNRMPLLPLPPPPNIHEPMQEFKDEEEQEKEAYELDQEKTSYTSSTTPHSHCSKGVSTNESKKDHKNGSNSIPYHSSLHQLPPSS